MKSNRIFISWLRWPLYVRIGLIIIALILLFGQLIYMLEPKQFTSVFEGVWWAVITVATVGYGDYVPQTPFGQIAGMVLVLSGASFVTAYFATLSSAVFSKQHRYVEGKVAFKGKGHVILIGWNEKSHMLLKELQHIAPSKTVVLIDDSLREGPLIENVHFIRGHAADDSTLNKANITEADTVILTADQQKNESEADMLSVLTLLAIKGLHPSVYCIVEILTERYVKNAERAGANKILCTSHLSSRVMFEHYRVKLQLAKPQTLSDLTLEKKVRIIPVPEELKGSSYHDCALYYLRRNTTIIGIQKEEGPMLTPPLSYQVLDTDLFLAL
ncbi:NAD-binding protein [Bacillus velezensis]|uniref:potassium channel family protein n=2 Tax=Bacillus TaxID=1386 RepID=UPI000BA65F78|nr:potassium channel family protein [Bacillus velezensis]MDX8369026.1 potassium channel family protein [Bacillus velezensis]NGM58595.1 potassium channel family protein [Bacillus velezensis]PAD05575.1 potassium channel protein [Bacillus velezensis]PAE77194.1 potassium channel protein [Bacillus velezensis]QPK88019.1 NAD-binding protein [Bacillus velezensis]